MEFGLGNRGGKGIENWQCIGVSGAFVHTRMLYSEKKWTDIAGVESSWSWVVGDKCDRLNGSDYSLWRRITVCFCYWKCTYDDDFWNTNVVIIPTKREGLWEFHYGSLLNSLAREN